MRPNHSTLQTTFKVLSNTALLIVGLSLGLDAVFWIRDNFRSHSSLSTSEKHHQEPGAPQLTPKRSSVQLDWIDTRSYEGIPDSVREQIFDDFFELEKQGKVFRPFVHFSTPPFQSHSVNTLLDENGFTERRTALAPTDDSPEIMVFGGSNTFGWLLTDEWTMANYLQRDLLQEDLRYRLRNYGMPYYSWPQEFILFSKLLEQGRRPKIAIFVDGVNYAYTTPMFSQNMEYMFEKSQFPLDTPLFQANFGIFRMMNYFARAKREKETADHLKRRYGNETFAISLPTDLEKTKQSYLETKKQIEAIGKAYGVRTLFVWQPTRLYHCSTEKYRAPIPADMLANVAELYPKMATIQDPNYLYLGELCSEMDPNARLFVDGVHYNHKMNEKLAQKVLSKLALKNN